MKVEFHPAFWESLEELDMDEDEKAEMIAEIHQMVEDGTLLENSEPITEEEYEELKKQGVDLDDLPSVH